MRSGHLLLCPTLFLLILSVAMWAAPSFASPRQLETWTGESQPRFSLPDLNGAAQALAERQGRVVLVHFFATWCEPCRAELASLTQLVAQHKPEDVSVLAVNVAEVPVRVRRFLDTAPVNFPVVLDTDRAVAKAWGVSGLPTTFVLDPNLATRLFVEGDLDWARADIRAAIKQLGAQP